VVDKLSAAQARRIALAAQGFGGSHSPVGTRQVNLAIHRLGLLQLDSVNVFERSHYLPLFARLGAYDRASLDRLTFTKRAPYVEYWAHQAALIPLEHRPLFHWRMDWFRANRGKNSYGTWAAANGEMLDFLRAELTEKGPLPSGRIEHDANRRTGSWWGWSDVKTGLEALLVFGEVVPTRINFERHYDLAERRIPAANLESSIPKTDAVRELVRFSLQALGVATRRDLSDYYRLYQDETQAALVDLVESGDAIPVAVEGWGEKAYLHRDARIPRRIEAMALLSPFDPIVWERARTERMFDLFYRIEIYTPAPKRQFGYYTLPVLQDEALVGRIDLKSDRQAGALRVQSAWRQPGGAPDVSRIAQLLRETAAWQGLGDLVVQDWGDLARELAAELRVPVVERTPVE